MRRRIAVERDGLRRALALDRLGEEGLGCGNVALGAQVEVHRLARSVDGAVEVAPLAPDESTVIALAELAADGMLRHRAVLQAQMVEAFLQRVHLSPLDQRRARLAAEAMRDIFAGTEWLSAEQVGEHSAIGDVVQEPVRSVELGGAFSIPAP